MPDPCPLTPVTPVRLRLSRAKGFNLQALSRAANGLPAMSCARPGRWGNRFCIGKSVPPSPLTNTTIEVRDAAHAVALHRVETLFYLGRWPDFLDPLRGKNLACWCDLGAPCHADTLLELANAPAAPPIPDPRSLSSAP